MRAICLFAVLVLVAAFAAAGFAEEPYVAKVDEDGYQRVEIEGGDYYFKPSRIVVRVNEPVKLVVRKKPGIVPHDIVMSAPEAGFAFKMDLSKEGTVITFIPTKTGTYPFYCDKKFLFFKSHRKKGMEGVLEVVE